MSHFVLLRVAIYATQGILTQLDPQGDDVLTDCVHGGSDAPAPHTYPDEWQTHSTFLGAQPQVSFISLHFNSTIRLIDLNSKHPPPQRVYPLRVNTLYIASTIIISQLWCLNCWGLSADTRRASAVGYIAVARRPSTGWSARPATAVL